MIFFESVKMDKLQYLLHRLSIPEKYNNFASAGFDDYDVIISLSVEEFREMADTVQLQEHEAKRFQAEIEYLNFMGTDTPLDNPKLTLEYL